jgi:predicted RNA-binding Zn ribbon-like protein
MVSTRAREIPHSLDLVIDFVNTADLEEGTDALATADGAGSWLVDRGLLRAHELPVSDRDRASAVKLREALRAIMLANNGAELSSEAEAQVDAAARQGELGLALEADGCAHLQARAGGVAGALAALVVPIAEGGPDGSWRRVKACRADPCQWAFYDRSRNHSGVWCDMAVCGNREKVRAYRSRSGQPART